ncbi:MAG: 6-phosphogluconolactonase, partial [Nitrospiraceae bacterium]
RVEFYFGDERCVPPDHPESNFHMVNEILFRPLGVVQKQIFRMRGEAVDPGQAALEYEGIIREQFSTPFPVWPRFDLILLGLGDDGHTASLFPDTPALQEKTRAVVTTRAPHRIRDRITFTVPVINEAHAVVFLVSGVTKADAVHEVLEGGPGLEYRYPAKLIQPAHGRLIWLLDREAASKLAVTKQQIEFDEE